MPPAEADQARPLSDTEAAALLAPFAEAGRIALAVSGGADSLALMAIVARWRPASLSVLVLTVDHRLQRGSGKTAAAVAEMARGLGLPVRVLVRKGPVPDADVEGGARTARYTLLLEACRKAGASHLVLAHQRDDLAEGFLMRLKRGAGVFGLAAMRPALDLGDLTIARPLLSVSRARLRATALAAGLAPVDDPMNTDPRFERARVRSLLPRLRALGFGADMLAETALRLADAAEAIEQAASDFLATAVETDMFAVAWLDAAAFARAPHAVRLRVLARIVMAVGGNAYPPRHDRLIALHDAILAGSDRLKRTLAGSVAEGGERRVAFYREVGRAGLPSVSLSPGTSGVWDGRFAFEVAAHAPAGLAIRSMPHATISLQPPCADVPAAALAAVPAVFRRGKALAPSPIRERFPSDSAGYVVLLSVLRARLDRPPRFPGYAAG